MPKGKSTAGIAGTAFPTGGAVSAASSFPHANPKGARPLYVTTGNTLSATCCAYAHCLCAPHMFAPDELPGVPTGGLRTFKFKTFARGTFECNTTGAGWIAFSARRGWQNTDASAYTSLAAGVSASITSEVSVTMVSLLNTTSATHEGYVRFVGACITAAYDGTLVNTEGHYLGTTVSAGTLVGATEAEMLTMASTPRTPVKHGATYCQLQQPLLMASAAGGIAQLHAWQRTDDSTSTSNSVTAAIFVQATANDRFTYSVDAVYEWVPTFGHTSASGVSATNALMTHTPADPVGLSAIETAMQTMPTGGDMRGADLGLGRKLIAAAGDVLKEGISGVGDTVRNVTRYVSAREFARLASRRYGGAAAGGAARLLANAELAATAGAIALARAQPSPLHLAQGHLPRERGGSVDDDDYVVVKRSAVK